MSKYARKVDSSQADIVRALHGAGCRVLDLSWCGRGLPDLHVVCPRGFLHWLEVKTEPPTKKPRKVPWVPTLTPAEEAMRELIPVKVVWTPAMALEAVGVA